MNQNVNQPQPYRAIRVTLGNISRNLTTCGNGYNCCMIQHLTSAFQAEDAGSIPVIPSNVVLQQCTIVAGCREKVEPEVEPLSRITVTAMKRKRPPNRGAVRGSHRKLVVYSVRTFFHGPHEEP